MGVIEKLLKQRANNGKARTGMGDNFILGVCGRYDAVGCNYRRLAYGVI